MKNPKQFLVEFLVALLLTNLCLLGGRWLGMAVASNEDYLPSQTYSGCNGTPTDSKCTSCYGTLSGADIEGLVLNDTKGCGNEKVIYWYANIDFLQGGGSDAPQHLAEVEHPACYKYNPCVVSGEPILGECRQLKPVGGPTCDSDESVSTYCIQCCEHQNRTVTELNLVFDNESEG
jgi:hypothetical protein